MFVCIPGFDLSMGPDENEDINSIQTDDINRMTKCVVLHFLHLNFFALGALHH